MHIGELLARPWLHPSRLRGGSEYLVIVAQPVRVSKKQSCGRVPHYHDKSHLRRGGEIQTPGRPPDEREN